MAKRQKEPKTSLRDEWLGKTWNTSQLLKRKEILTCSKNKEPQRDVLSEISQAQKDTLRKSTFLKCLEHSNAERQRVGWWRLAPRAGGWGVSAIGAEP